MKSQQRQRKPLRVIRDRNFRQLRNGQVVPEGRLSAVGFRKAEIRSDGSVLYVLDGRSHFDRWLNRIVIEEKAAIIVQNGRLVAVCGNLITDKKGFVVLYQNYGASRR